MSGISFQKVTLPNGQSYTVMRSGIGEPEREFVVNEVSFKGNVFKKYGTYDECMDYVSQLIDTCTVPEHQSELTVAAMEAANSNFHRELG